MASVDLEHVWLHDADNLSDYIRLRSRNISTILERNIGRRAYAGGRIRAVSSPAVEQSIEWEALMVNRETLDQLEDWLGETLLYRDPWGRSVYGFLSELPSTDRLAPIGKADVSLVFKVVTEDESV